MVVFGPLGWLKADNWLAVSRKGNEGQCLGRGLSQGQGEVWRELWRQISSFLLVLTTSILPTKFYLFKREMYSYHFFIQQSRSDFKTSSKQAQKSSFARATKTSLFCRAGESASAWQRRWEPSKGPESWSSESQWEPEWKSQRAIESQRETGRDPVRAIWKACYKKEASLTFLAYLNIVLLQNN